MKNYTKYGRLKKSTCVRFDSFDRNEFDHVNIDWCAKRANNKKCSK